MRQSPQDKLNIQRDFREMRQDSRDIFLLYPNITSVSVDTDMQTGLNVSLGDGTGRTVAWTVYTLRGVITVVTQNLITYGQVPAGVQVGDCKFFTQRQEDPVIEKAYANQYHYLSIDQITFRIQSLRCIDVGHDIAREVWCSHFTPTVFRCTGY